MTEINRTKIGVMTYLAPASSFTESDDLTMLRQTIETCLAEHETDIILDLHQVGSLNSKALEELLTVHEKLARRGGSLKVVNANTLLQDIFLVSGLKDHIAILDSE